MSCFAIRPAKYVLKSRWGKQLLRIDIMNEQLSRLGSFYTFFNFFPHSACINRLILLCVNKLLLKLLTVCLKKTLAETKAVVCLKIVIFSFNKIFTFSSLIPTWPGDLFILNLLFWNMIFKIFKLNLENYLSHLSSPRKTILFPIAYNFILISNNFADNALLFSRKLLRSSLLCLFIELVQLFECLKIIFVNFVF